MTTRALEPTVLVIFGASGDLAHRSLWPAMYNLLEEGQLPQKLRIVAVASNLDEETFSDEMFEAVSKYARHNVERDHWDTLMESVVLLSGDFESQTTFNQLSQIIKEAENDFGKPTNTLFYMAVAPRFVSVIAKELSRIGYAKDNNCVRVVVEKPFGKDLASAVVLNKELHEYFYENQIFRMDHYLGKETVQNLLVLRFANGIFEPLWNSNYIDHVQITVAEPDGVGSRAGYYEGVGAMRDVLQNHMMQLLAYIAMEPPTRFDADEIRSQKWRVLDSATIPDIENAVVRAQYVESPDGISYTDEKGVPDDSTTETYVAMRVEIGNWRWGRTPFYLRTGKRLSQKKAEIVVRFKPVPHLPFEDTEPVEPNELVISLQPHESVSLRTIAKVPGQTMQTQPVLMKFDYQSSFKNKSPQAYERLIFDAMAGDPTLFMRADEVEAAWKIFEPLLAHWENDNVPMARYEVGSDGPGEADLLLWDRGRQWNEITETDED